MKPSNPLLGEIKSLGARASSTICKMCITFDQLSKEEQEALTLAFKDATVQATMIGRWLRSRKDADGENYHVSDLSIRRHRRGDCKHP